MKSITTAMPKNAAPNGLPTRRSFACSDICSLFSRDVLRRKSCVTAMPMLAKEREVRSQARYVRSILQAHHNYD